MNKKQMNKKVLVISPHQDDEVIGCGGLIARLVRDGSLVDVVYVLSGYSGIAGHNYKYQSIKKRENEARAACKKLGIHKFFFLRERDRETVYNTRLLKKIVNVIRKVKPNIVLAPHEDESDYEHKMVNRLTREAVWMAKSDYFLDKKITKWEYELILFYEVWTPIKQPNYYEDITKFIDSKISALKEYQSQNKVINYIDAVLGLNRYRGEMSRTGKYAEAYYIKRVLKLI